MYRTPRKPRGDGYRLNIKPTEADHEYVRSLWRTMVTVRGICRALGERYGLGKPMSRLTLYHHFRADMPKRAWGKANMPKREVEDVRAMVEKLRARRNAA